MSLQDRFYDPLNHVWYIGTAAALDDGQAVGFDGIPGSARSEHFLHFNPDTIWHAQQENLRRYVIDISNTAWNTFCDWDYMFESHDASFDGVTINDIISSSMTRLYVLYH